MRILSCFFILIFAAGVISCTGDDETITIKTEQCYNGTTVNITEGEECPTPPPPTMGNGDTSGGDTSGGDAGGGDDGSTGGECNLNATGKAPFTGSSDDDVICGDGDNNTISALGGEDIVRAKGGNDIIDGGSGNDELYGEAGNDILTGGEDEDVIDGGPGNDTLTGSEGRDELIGGDGIDTVKYIGRAMEADDGDAVALEISLANGYSNDEYGDRDTYVGIENVITGPGDDTITGDGGANRIDGGGGQTNSGNLIDGGAGTDTLVVGVTTILNGNEGPNHTNFENLAVRAGAEDVTLTGDNNINVLTGNEEANTLVGGGGNDMLNGGAGADTLRGQDGRDTLTGGDGNDCFEFSIGADLPLDATAETADKNAAVAKITATLDTVRDFKDGDRVGVVNGGNHVEAQRDKIVVTVASGRDAEADPPVTRISPVTVTLANISGLPAETTIGAEDCS